MEHIHARPVEADTIERSPRGHDRDAAPARIQRTLQVGAADDAFEREADDVAHRVMDVLRSGDALGDPVVPVGDSARVQPMLHRSTPTVQREVSGGQVGDPVEQTSGGAFTIERIDDESGDRLYTLKSTTDDSRVRVFGNVKTYNLVAKTTASPAPTTGTSAGPTTGQTAGPTAGQSPTTGVSGTSGASPPPTIPSGPLLPAQLATLTVSVSDGDLDKGSKMLKDLRGRRPATNVNTGGADALSNCALTTLAGITGVGTSTAASKDVQSKLYQITQPGRAQSEKMWAISILDGETLKDAGLVQQGAAAVNKARGENEKMAKDLDAFPQGRSYALGSAQYFGLLKYLMTAFAPSASTSTSADVTYALYREGLPGEGMLGQSALLGKMKAYPNGTRFAVYVFSNDPSPTRHVKQHYVYAEKFNGNVIFQDFQTSKKGAGGDAYLDQFPFSPDEKDNKATFDEGCFVAVVPTFAGEPASSTPPGTPISESEIATELALAKAHVTKYSSKVGGADAMPTSWPQLYGSVLAEIPAPSAIQDGYQTLAGQLGVTATCKFDLTGEGVIRMVGQPEHKVFGSTTVINIKRLNDVTKVVKPGQSGSAVDTGELPVPATGGMLRWSPEAEKEEYTAFSKSYNVAAQNTDSGIVINADMAQFTDLIHEAAHAHEQGDLPAHIREGAADIFASMVSTNIKSAHTDARFDYSYNPSYAPFVVAVHQLIDAFGLAGVAKMYFESTNPKADLKALVTAKLGTTRASEVDEITNGLLDEGFPAKWKPAITQLTGGSLTKATGSASSFDAARGDFETKLERERPTTMSTADLLDVAQSWSDRDGLAVMEKRLKLLYTQAEEARGTSYIEVMKLISNHEIGIGKITGESREDLKARLTGKAYTP